MSQSTPAKQDRYERHLMRQRGAGVRPLAANFAFSFDFAAPTSSSDPAPIADPPTKRQKTVAYEHSQPTTKEEVATITRIVVEEPVVPVKVTKRAAKSRGRLPVDTAEEPPRPAPTETVDDSFIVKARPKKGQKKQEVEDPNSLDLDREAESAPVPTKSRAKRKAKEPSVAVEAIVKEDDLAPPPGKRKSRKRVAAAKKTKVEKAATRATRKAAQRKRNSPKADGADITHDEHLSPVPDLFEEDMMEAPVPEPAPPKSMSRRNVTEVSVLEPSAMVEEPAAPAAVGSKPRVRASTTTRKTKAHKTPPKPARKVARRKRQEAEVIDELPAHQAVQSAIELDEPPVTVTDLPIELNQEHTARQPLLDADVNVVGRSISPEKLRDQEVLEVASKRYTAIKKQKKVQAEAEVPPAGKTKASRRRQVGAQMDTAEACEVQGEPLTGVSEVLRTEKPKTSRRRKLRVEQDNRPAETEAVAIKIQGGDETRATPHEAQAELEVPEIAASESPDDTLPKAGWRPDDSVSAPTLSPAHETAPVEGAKAKPKKSSTTAVKKVSAAAASAAKTELADDDMDWLFAPQVVKAPPRTGIDKAKAKSQKRRSYARLADVDLDDLVTNIASIAPAPTSKGSTAVRQSADGKRIRRT